MLIENEKDLENLNDRKLKILILGDGDFFDSLDVRSQNYLIKDIHVGYVLVNDVEPKNASRFLNFDETSWYENNILAFIPYSETYTSLDAWPEKLIQSKNDTIANILILLGAKKVKIASISEDITDSKQLKNYESSFELREETEIASVSPFKVDTTVENKENSSQEIRNYNSLFQEDIFETELKEPQYDPSRAQQLISKYNLTADIPYLNSIASFNQKLKFFQLKMTVKKELSLVSDLTLTIANKLGLDISYKTQNIGIGNSLILLSKKITNYRLKSSSFLKKIYKIEVEF